MAKSIKQLQLEADLLSNEEKLLWIQNHEDDERKGVQKLLKSIGKKIQSEIDEDLRIEKMTIFEKEANEKGYRLIAGIDEVGRGPLAGPVVTCAVILKEWLPYKGINDSKKVSLKNRLRLFEEIDDTAIAVAYGMASPEEIDEYNILEATKMAMLRAIDALDVEPDCLLIDAVKLNVDIPQVSIIKGDEKSVTIAAASIMAKITRDEMMIAYNEEFPGYDFAGNKGYGTKRHYEGLDEKGLTPIHRKSFVKEYL